MYTTKDLELAKIILIEEFKKNNKVLKEEEIIKKSKNILEIIYSIGGAYNKETIKEVAKTCLEENMI